MMGAWCSIPWPSDPDEKAALIASSLGPGVIEWAEGRTDVPGLRDYLTGNPWRYTPGQKRFLILWFAVDAAGRWLYRSGVYRGSKGTGKDPVGATLCDAELLGPTHLDRWENGRPIGEPHALPLVQIAANSEAQAKDVLRIANAMLSDEARAHYGIDCGETRTTVAGGGRLELLTASEKSSEGDPATFIMLNESQHMTESNGGHKVAQVARRNVGNARTSCTPQSRRHHQRTCMTTSHGWQVWPRRTWTPLGLISNDSPMRCWTRARPWLTRSGTT